MDHATRRALYATLEAQRASRVLLFATSDRPGLETQIASDAVVPFVELLDEIGPTKKLSLILHTNGGSTSTAWRLVNLIRTFCDDLEVIIPLQALSAGTLMALGADRIVMTKQAALGPIDPSLTHPLSPSVQVGPGAFRQVPVSVEAVRGYFEQATKELKITDSASLGTVLVDLAGRIHPLVLGQILRSQAQIRYLADKLLTAQVHDPVKAKKIIDFLCAESGSHDYTINRREAAEHGLVVEKPSPELYALIRAVYQSYVAEMKLLEPHSPKVMLGGAATADYKLVRGLIESGSGGCYGFVSKGTLSKTVMAGPNNVAVEGITDSRDFEGWEKL